MTLLAVVLAGGSAMGQVHVNGSVYGGGNKAEVTGSTNVRIGKD